MKLGAIYVPIDPEYPSERIAYIRENCKAKLLLSTREIISAKGLKDAPLLAIEDVLFKEASALPYQNNASDIAYIIYTSGSTGKPKGVMIRHRSAVNFVKWYQTFYNVDATSRGTLFASPAFDASMMEMLPYILGGGSVYPLHSEMRNDLGTLISFYKKHSITHSFVPPAICEELCNNAQDELPEKIKLLTGGDVLRNIENTNISVANNYGPTESTIVASASFLSEKQKEEGISMGKPIANTKIYLLDKKMRPVAIGIPGEIYIAGAGLAQGYLNEEAQTAEKFITSPFRKERLYKSGDIAKWNADGSLVFIGRNDQQIKIRGYRVELEEVEKVLQNHPVITQATVIARLKEDKQHELIGFYLLQEEATEQEIRTFLSSQLPCYMIPNKLIVIDKLPLTSRGKIDRDALLKRSVTESINPVAKVPPRDPHEEALAKIWEEVLAVDNIGVHTDFFEAGGHSLSATRVMSRIRVQFGVELPFRSLFENRTIALLARAVENVQKQPLTKKPRPAISRSSRRGNNASNSTIHT